MRRPQEVPLGEDVLAVSDPEAPNVGELLRAVGRLPFNQRSALAMRELEGRTYPEIAETLGVTIPAVEALIARARRTLRMRVGTLRGLAVLPLPRSLRRLWENGEAAAGGALGTGVVAKAAAVVLVGIAGFSTVEAGALRENRTTPARLGAPVPLATGWRTASSRLPVRRRGSSRAAFRRADSHCRRRCTLGSACSGGAEWQRSGCRSGLGHRPGSGPRNGSTDGAADRSAGGGIGCTHRRHEHPADAAVAGRDARPARDSGAGPPGRHARAAGNTAAAPAAPLSPSASFSQ
jgi:hypothetical protein